MSVVDTIVRGVQDLPLSEQVNVVRYVHGLSASAHDKRATLLLSAFGALDEADGLAFEEAMQSARRMEANG